MLCIQLQNYNELDKDCKKIVEELEHYYSSDIPAQYKVDIIAVLLPFYISQGENNNVLEFEKEIPFVAANDIDLNSEVSKISWNTIYMSMGVFSKKWMILKKLSHIF